MAEFRKYFKHYRNTAYTIPKQTVHNQNRRTQIEKNKTNKPNLIDEESASSNQIPNNVNNTLIESNSCPREYQTIVSENQIEYNSIESELTGNTNQNETTINFNTNSITNTKETLCAGERGVISEDTISTALLSLFFSANLTKTALESTIQLIQLLVPDIRIPKTFDQLILRVQEYNLKYEKHWFCQKCKEFVRKETSGDSKQRICLNCNNR